MHLLRVLCEASLSISALTLRAAAGILLGGTGDITPAHLLADFIAELTNGICEEIASYLRPLCLVSFGCDVGTGYAASLDEYLLFFDMWCKVSLSDDNDDAGVDDDPLPTAVDIVRTRTFDGTFESALNNQAVVYVKFNNDVISFGESHLDCPPWQLHPLDRNEFALLPQQKRLYLNRTNEWKTDGEFYVRAGLAVVCGETEPTIVTDVAAIDHDSWPTLHNESTKRLKFGAGPNFQTNKDARLMVAHAGADVCRRIEDSVSALNFFLPISCSSSVDFSIDDGFEIEATVEYDVIYYDGPGEFSMTAILDDAVLEQAYLPEYEQLLNSETVLYIKVDERVVQFGRQLSCPVTREYPNVTLIECNGQMHMLDDVTGDMFKLGEFYIRNATAQVCSDVSPLMTSQALPAFARHNDVMSYLEMVWLLVGFLVAFVA